LNYDCDKEALDNIYERYEESDQGWGKKDD
jgi:hypothetical protein